MKAKVTRRNSDRTLFNDSPKQSDPDRVEALWRALDYHRAGGVTTEEVLVTAERFHEFLVGST